MKYLLSFLLPLILLLPSTTQAQEITDPNAHLGLDQDLIEYICDSSNNLTSAAYKNIPNLTSFEETLYEGAGKENLLLSLHSQSLPLPPESQAEIGVLWNEKYNQIYCPMGADFSPPGYLEFKLLMSGQTLALGMLYDSNYKLNINRLVKLYPYDSDEEAEWVTLADLMKHYIENPVGQMTQAKGLRQRFQNYYNIFTGQGQWEGGGLGAKHASQLTPAEFAAAKAKAMRKF